jgi:hypothetical protein
MLAISSLALSTLGRLVAFDRRAALADGPMEERGFNLELRLLYITAEEKCDGGLRRGLAVVDTQLAKEAPERPTLRSRNDG